MSSLRDEMALFSINLSLWALNSSGHSIQTIGWLQLLILGSRGLPRLLSDPFANTPAVSDES